MAHITPIGLSQDGPLRTPGKRRDDKGIPGTLPTSHTGCILRGSHLSALTKLMFKV